MEIFTVVNELPWIGSTYYCETRKVIFHRYRESLHLTFAADALKRGKTCRTITINLPVDRFDSCDIENAVNRTSIDQLIEAVSAHELTWKFTDVEVAGFRFQLTGTEMKAARVWAPWAKVNKLKQLPNKWTIAHVVRGLLSGQITVYNKMTLTDDYAYDNAARFQEGALDSVKFAKELISSPDGWRAYVSDNRLNINCHQFRYVEGNVAL